MRDRVEIYRRHSATCAHKSKDRYTRCDCWIWAKGRYNGKPFRKRSLKTKDWGRAGRLLAEILDNLKDGRESKPVGAAVEEFLSGLCDRAEGTMRNHRRCLHFLLEFLRQEGCRTIEAVTFAVLKDFRATRKISALTWSRERASLVMFFKFCMKCKWTDHNPATELETPKNIKETAKDPFTMEELIRIDAAAGAIGTAPYERLRARAMIRLLRHTAFRISDVALLERSRVSNGHILIRTLKTGQVVLTCAGKAEPN